MIPYIPMIYFCGYLLMKLAIKKFGWYILQQYINEKNHDKESSIIKYNGNISTVNK